MHRDGEITMIPLVYHPQIRTYYFGETHPFHQERYDDFMTLLRDQGYQDHFTFVTPNSATQEDLLSVHTHGYIDQVYALAQLNGRLTMDTPLVPGIIDAGKILVGHGLKAMDLIMKGEKLVVTFGGTHHAGRDYGGGFCLFNDVAIIAQRLLNQGIERILILDTDAHHGNGTQDIFYGTKEVLYVSLHQDPRTLYPGTGFAEEIGEGNGKGYTVNIPLLPFSGDNLFLMALEEIVEPLAAQFDPQVVIRNGGSDVHYLDELTHLGVTCDGLYRIGKKAKQISSRCNRHIDLTLSGYNRVILPYAWLSLICGVCALTMPEVPPQISGAPQVQYGKDEVDLTPATQSTLERLKRYLKPYWSFR